MFFYLIVTLFTLFLISYLKKYFHFKRKGLPHTPVYPFMGFEALFQDPKQIHLDRRKKHGSVYGTFIGSLPLTVVTDPEIAKAVTIKEAYNFTDTNPFKLNIKYFKDSFILKKGKEWKDGRSLVSPVFTTKKIKDIFAHFQKASQPLFSNIEGLIKEGKQDEIDIKILLKNYGLDVIAKFVYAIDINSAKDKDHPFVKSVLKLVDFNNFFNVFAIIMGLLPRKLVESMDIQFVDSKSMEYLADLTRSLIKERNANKDQNYNDFLDLLLHTIEEKNIEVPEEEIIGICIIFFFAGLETVGLTISNALYLLALHSEYQEKLHQELIDLYPNKEISYSNINDSRLLDAVLKESQRLLPALNFIFRIAENSITINGLKIEANDLIGIDVYSLHNSAEFWENPEQFRPERFLEKDIKFENDDLFKPFGTGVRSCIASRMAIVQVKYVIAQLVLNYQIYRSAKTVVPPKYLRNPQQLIYKNMVLGFTKREN